MIIALTGGVGGAKFITGLAAIVAPEELTIVVNTGDDFNHWGLPISPDLDSVMYKLAGINNKETGWGMANETWHTLQAMQKLGAEDWFQIGDQDLATHIERHRLLQTGHTLSETTRLLCQRLHVKHSLIPMSDDAVATRLHTSSESLAFQDYFVKHQSRPIVQAISYEGASLARPNFQFMSALLSPALQGIVISPSNPLLSIAPILALPGITEVIKARRVPVIAISPLIQGKAFKGPTAKLMTELGMESSVVGIGKFYQPMVTHVMIDSTDAHHCSALEMLGMRGVLANITLTSTADAISLAQHVVKRLKN